MLNKDDIIFDTMPDPLGHWNYGRYITGVVLIHKPTGIRVECDEERSQPLNCEIALAELDRLVSERTSEETSDAK